MDSHSSALTRNLWATIRDSLDDSWNPILEGTLADLRVEDIMNMQQSLIHLQPVSRRQGR